MRSYVVVKGGTEAVSTVTWSIRSDNLPFVPARILALKSKQHLSAASRFASFLLSPHATPRAFAPRISAWTSAHHNSSCQPRSVYFRLVTTLDWCSLLRVG